jgi:hypothetical protein
MSKQTAVEWLVSEYAKAFKISVNAVMGETIEQAKAMEKGQIIEAYLTPLSNEYWFQKDEILNQESEKYYNETYGGEQMSKEQQELLDEVYGKYADSHWTPPSNPKGKLLSDQLFSVIPMEYSKESFINKIKTDSKFSEKWGLKIEERELSLEERSELGYKYVEYNKWDALLGGGKESDEELCDDYNIPTKLITITYNDKTIESYEN